MDDEPVGVLLLSGSDLTFLGVVPEWRGQGVGRALLTAACEAVPQLSLVVDSRNAPAVQLYQSAGFQVTGSREVFLWFPGAAA